MTKILSNGKLDNRDLMVQICITIIYSTVKLTKCTNNIKLFLRYIKAE